jgi:myosin heavy subunit
MDTNVTNVESGSSPKRNSNLIYWLLGIIAVLFASNIFVYLKKNETSEQLKTQTVQAKDEKASMQLELNKLESDLAASNNGSQKLTADLQEKDTELKTKIAELRKALRDKSITRVELGRAREEIKQLSYKIQKYNTDITNLTTANKQLTTENSSLKTTVDSVSQTSTRLKSDNESLQKKVSTASALRSSSIVVVPVKVKSNGKEVDVTRAKKANKIRVTFTIADNELSAEGSHDIYLQIFDPAGKIEAGPNSGNFTTSTGDNLQFTTHTSINYVKATKTYTLEWPKNNDLVPGDYKAVIYADSYKMGESGFHLKKPGLF